MNILNRYSQSIMRGKKCMENLAILRQKIEKLSKK